MTVTPNSPQELLNLQKSQVDKVLEELGELTVLETHQVIRYVLSFMKEQYGEFFEKTENNQFLWDGCKVGTCLQVFNSLHIFSDEEETDEDG